MPLNVRTTILAQFEHVARTQGKALSALSDDLPLVDCGLDSLCFAILVARLDDALGCDPFSTTESAEFPATVGDFVRFYEHAAP
jgi:hypothetical protein